MASAGSELRKRRRSTARRSSAPSLGVTLRAWLSNIEALTDDFALLAEGVFERLDHRQASMLSFEDVIVGFRELGLEVYVDGEEGGNVGEGDECRRQLRLWTGRGSAYGCTDWDCFLWVAWRGYRFRDAVEALSPVFEALDAERTGLVNLHDINRALLEDVGSADISKLQENVREFYEYHAGKRHGIDFASFIAMVCDIQDRFALGVVAGRHDDPIACLIRSEQGVNFQRPMDAHIFSRNS